MRAQCSQLEILGQKGQGTFQSPGLLWGNSSAAAQELDKPLGNILEQSFGKGVSAGLWELPVDGAERWFGVL